MSGTCALFFGCSGERRGVDEPFSGKADGWRNYAGEMRGLSDAPFLVIVPPTLVEQVAAECQRFLEPGSFNIIKITGALNKHSELWEMEEKYTALERSRTIYVATTSVSVIQVQIEEVERESSKPRRRQAVQSESGCIHKLRGRAKPGRDHRADRNEKYTVFRQRYLGIAMDEAHNFRNVNKLYGAVRALRDLTDILVAMTATPVQTRATASARPRCCRSRGRGN